NVEIALRLLQEEPVGASELEQSAAVAMLADERHGTGKLSAQHPLGVDIVRVAVRMPAREIFLRIVFRGIEIARVRAPEPALRTAQEFAAILAKHMPVLRHRAAGGTRQWQLARLGDGAHITNTPFPVVCVANSR